MHSGSHVLLEQYFLFCILYCQNFCSRIIVVSGQSNVFDRISWLYSFQPCHQDYFAIVIMSITTHKMWCGKYCWEWYNFWRVKWDLLSIHNSDGSSCYVLYNPPFLQERYLPKTTFVQFLFLLFRLCFDINTLRLLHSKKKWFSERFPPFK